MALRDSRVASCAYGGLLIDPGQCNGGVERDEGRLLLVVNRGDGVERDDGVQVTEYALRGYVHHVIASLHELYLTALIRTTYRSTTTCHFAVRQPTILKLFVH